MPAAFFETRGPFAGTLVLGARGSAPEHGEVLAMAKHSVDDSATRAILDHYEFTAPDRVRTLLRAVLGGALLAALAAGGFALKDRGHTAIIEFGVCIVIVVIAWTTLLSRNPQRIIIDKSNITIRRGSTVERFDLVDPNLEILARDGEFEFRYYDGTEIFLRPAEVDWKTFMHVVMHYQSFADNNAIDRQARWER